MRTLPKPSFTAGDVFKTSISRVRTRTLKTRLENCLTEVIQDTLEYEKKALRAQLHLLPKKTLVNGNVTKEEMEKIYTSRMVPKNGPGRNYYEKLRYPPGSDKCPFCGQRPSSTLDHYLAKSDYPTLVVSPINLVPACKDCNFIKSNSFPTKSEEETLHPYFDSIDDQQWLYGRVNQTTPPSISYYIKAPTHASSILAERVKYHFSLYDLGTLYASEAATELSDIEYMMDKMLRDVGPQAVQKHLEEIAESCAQNKINSWKTAMYQALANNNWYCNEGALI
jgi:hypothetical protein